MANFPIGLPVLGALSGAAWVLGGDGSDQAAKAGAGIGFIVGLGMAFLKQTADSSAHTAAASTVGRARRGPPPSRSKQ